MKTASQGIALVQVLLVFALLTAVMAAIQYDQRLFIDRLDQQLNLSQLTEYANSAEAIAQAGLRLDHQQSNTDHLAELWNTPLGPLSLDPGSISLEINDLQGRFNLNSLHPQQPQQMQMKAAFARLLGFLQLNSAIAEELAQWMDVDGGAEFRYTQMDPPYLPSFMPLADPSELLLLEGVDRQAYQTLLPYVAALPVSAALNVNTAPPQVLAALFSAISLERATDLVALRAEQPFTQVDDFLQRAQLVGDNQPEIAHNRLSVRSDYFELFCQAQRRDQVLWLTSRLYRDAQGQVHSIARDYSRTQANRIAQDDKTINPLDTHPQGD